MSNSPEAPLEGVNTSTLAGLREALTRNGPQTPRVDDEVHQAIRALAAEARSSGIPVEQLIIYLKREWNALGLIARSRPRADGAAVVERLVSICLDEYFVDA